MKSQRLFEIVTFVNRRKFCSMAELIAHFKVSPATLNRDLTELAGKERLRKVRGGVEAIDTSDDSADKVAFPFAHYRSRLGFNVAAKSQVAGRALSEIQDGDIIFLDSSTTVYQLARQLQASSFVNLTIITNSLLIIQEFPLFPPHYFLVALGGGYDLQLNAFLGKITLSELEMTAVTRAFVSALGVTSDGVYSRHENHALFLGRVVEKARESILLVTSDKIGKSGLFKIAEPAAFARIVSEEGVVPRL